MKKTIISVCAAALLSGTILSTPRPASAGASSAYIAHTTINIAMVAIGMYITLRKVGELMKLPALVSALPVWPGLDYAGVIALFGQAAITQWMDKSGKILAEFTGEEGHVTDKWVGPPEMNKTVYTVEEFVANDVASFNVDVPVVDIAYESIKNPRKSSARSLAAARRTAKLAANQSNTGGNEE